jgi:hypothetical protein
MKALLDVPCEETLNEMPMIWPESFQLLSLMPQALLEASPES